MFGHGKTGQAARTQRLGRQQRAAGVALAALAEGAAQDAAYITPNYLRLPQAERERLARMKDKKE